MTQGCVIVAMEAKHLFDFCYPYELTVTRLKSKYLFHPTSDVVFSRSLVMERQFLFNSWCRQCYFSFLVHPDILLGPESHVK